jgi:hypothetical protein
MKKRFKLLLLWLLCVVFSVPLLLAMLVQALVGSEVRAKAMAVAQDECGNALFGGPANETISAHVGDAFIQGRKWAQVVAPIIDFLFGKGHCLSNVDLPASQLTPAQVQAVDEADKEQGNPNSY